MSRDLQHWLHTRLEAVTETLDLPLDAGHLERLAVELTPAVKALLAQQERVAPSPSCTRCYGADAERFVALGGATAACPACGPSELRSRVVELEAQVTEYERPADEDPIAYALTDQAEKPFPPYGGHDPTCAYVSGMTTRCTCAELADDVTPQVAKLRALLADQATDGAGFFQPGHGYTHRPGADSPGGPRLRFYCESVTTGRTTGQPVARGWGGRRYGDRWTSVQQARGLEDWQSGAWVDTTAGGER